MKFIEKETTLMALILISLLQIAVFACSDGTNNCFTCANTLNCQSCYYGYGLISSAGFTVCQLCTEVNCYECYTHPKICTSCAYMYGLIGSSCQPCSDPSCYTCDGNINVCTYCMPYYRISSGACERCLTTACQYCPSNASICSSCEMLWGVQGTTCAQCSDSNCVYCSTDFTQCTLCNSPLGVSVNGTCGSCQDSNCISCTYDYQFCSRCAAGYGVSGSVCISCNYGQCTNCSQFYAPYCYECSSGYGAYLGDCLPCHNYVSNCQQCSRYVYNCTSCATGYGLNANQTSCEPCSASCLTCLGSSSTSCASCVDQYYVSLTFACLPCASNCLVCLSSTTCLLCIDGLFADAAHTCQICPAHCTLCAYDNATSSVTCTACQPNFGLSRYEPRSCPQICGDLITQIFACDDELGRQYDGCDDYCSVMPGFVCNITNNVSVCSYASIVGLQIVSLVRNLDSNSFTMKVKIWPPFFVLRSSDLKSVFTIADPAFTIRSIDFANSLNQLIFKIDFIGHYWDRELILRFVPDKSIDVRYYATPQSQAVIRTQLYFYSDLALKTNKMIPYLCYTVVGIAFFSAGLGLFVKRLAGLESLVTCQLALLSIVWINCSLLDPFNQAKMLRYLLAYQISLVSSSTHRILIDQRQNSWYLNESPYLNEFGLKLTPRPSSLNINIALALHLILLFCALIAMVVSKYMQRKRDQYKCQKNQEQFNITDGHMSKAKVFKQYFLQWAMYFAVLNLVMFTLSVTIFFKSGVDIAANATTVAILAVGVLAYIFTFLIFSLDADSFDQFRYSFRPEAFAMLFYWLYTPAIILTVLLLDSTWPCLVPMTCLWLFSLLYRPYRELRENIRTVLNSLIVLAFLSLRVFNSYFNPGSILVDSNVFAIYFVALVLLLLSVGLGLVLTIHYLVMKCWGKKQERDDKQRVMLELQQIDVRQRMKALENTDNIFKKLLSPKMNILDASNTLGVTASDKEHDFVQQPIELDSLAKSKNIQKELRKQRAISHLLQKKQLISHLKHSMETEQVAFSKKQKEENNKLIYAMEILNDENTWIRLKNARDYTQSKMKQMQDQANLEQYNNI